MNKCHKCGQPAEIGFTCNKCKREKQALYLFKYRNKKRDPKWEFKIGIKEEKIKQLAAEIAELKKKIEEVKTNVN